MFCFLPPEAGKGGEITNLREIPPKDKETPVPVKGTREIPLVVPPFFRGRSPP